MDDVPELVKPLQVTLQELMLRHDDKVPKSITEELPVIFEHYRKLRQIPELFSELSKVLSSLREQSSLDDSRAFEWPNGFLDKFAIACEELSATQFLSLWEIILDGSLEESNDDSSWIVGLWVSLFSNLLMRARLLEQTIPQHLLSKANILMESTSKSIGKLMKKYIITNNIGLVSTKILSLAYIWGELKLMLNKYAANESSNSAEVPERKAWDLNCIHSYMTPKMSSKLHVLISESNNLQLNYVYCLLLVQKIKSKSLTYNRCTTDSEVVAKVLDELQSTATYLAQIVKRSLPILFSELPQLSSSDQEVQLSYWESILEMFPMMTEWWSLDTLTDVTETLIDFIVLLMKKDMEVALKFIKYLSGSCYIESKAFQTSFVSCFVQKIHNELPSKLRSHFEPFFSVIMAKLPVWMDEADVHSMGKNNALSWQLIQEAGKNLNEIFSDTSKSSIKTQSCLSQIHMYLQLVSLLPARHLLPGNQTRFVFVLLVILHCLEKQTDSSRTVRNLCLELLTTILDGIRSVWFLDFFPSDSFVLWFLSRVGSSLQEDTNRDQVLTILKICVKRFSTMVRTNKLSQSQLTLLFEKVTSVDLFDPAISNLQRELWMFVITAMLKEICETRHAFKSIEMKKLLQTHLLMLAKSVLVHVKKLKGSVASSPLFASSLVHAYALTIDSLKKSPKKFKKWKKYFPSIYHMILQMDLDVDGDPALVEDLLQFYNHIIPLWEIVENDDLDKGLFIRHFWKISIQFYGAHVQRKTDALSSNYKNLAVALETAISNSIIYSTEQELNSILESMTFQETDDPDFHLKIKCWHLIAFNKLPPNNLKICRENIQTVVAFLVIKLDQMDLTNQQLISNIYVPSQELLIHLIQQGKKALDYPTVQTYFHLGLQFHKYTSINNIELFCEVSINAYQILSSLCIHQRDIVKSNIPAFLIGVNGIFEALLKKSDMSLEPSEHEIDFLVIVAQNINRLFSLIASNKTEFCKVVPYIICEYVFKCQELAVAPVVTEGLARGVYDLLDTCDEHGINMLHSNLPPSKKEVFKNLIQNYEKHRKLNQKFKRLRVR